MKKIEDESSRINQSIKDQTGPGPELRSSQWPLGLIKNERAKLLQHELKFIYI